MNWHNRFIRIWIVMSAVWAGTIAWEAYRLLSAAAGGSEPISNPIFAVLKYLALATVPPLGVAGVGILMWLVGQIFEAVLLRCPRQPLVGPAPRATSRQSIGEGRRRRGLSIGSMDGPSRFS